MELPSSFWVDEMVTRFVVAHGASHPSLRIAPQVPQSIYYPLIREAAYVFAPAEIGYRLPSVLFMGLALFFIAKLASRLIHPDAAWFAVFACLSLSGINYQAADARPYAMGTCVAAAALYFLVRWLDAASPDPKTWLDAGLFVLFAALLWRVHLIFWPFYLVFAIYAGLRVVSRETQIEWWKVLAIFIVIGIAIAPVALRALALNGEAKAHVIVKLPQPRDLRNSLKFLLVVVCGTGAWVVQRIAPKNDIPKIPAASAWALILGWWLVHPLALFAYSHGTGNSVFVPRYLSLLLPGAALAGTLAAALFLPARFWKPAALAMGVGALIAAGSWKELWPRHHNSDWREAASAINELNIAGTGIPVICPSPFIEAKPPVWQPDYPLPGFLYAHLETYTAQWRPILFPFEDSPEAETYAESLAQKMLPEVGKFVIYGGDRNVRFWRDWFKVRPEFDGWSHRGLGQFGDVDAVVFEKHQNRGQFPHGINPSLGNIKALDAGR